MMNGYIRVRRRRSEVFQNPIIFIENDTINLCIYGDIPHHIERCALPIDKSCNCGFALGRIKRDIYRHFVDAILVLRLVDIANNTNGSATGYWYFAPF